MDRISFFKGEKRTVFATKYIKPQDKKQKEEKKENEKNTPDENPDSVFTDIRHDCLRYVQIGAERHGDHGYRSAEKRRRRTRFLCEDTLTVFACIWQVNC